MSVRFWRLFRRFLGCFTVTVFTTDDEAVRPEGDVVWTWAGLRYLTVVELWDPNHNKYPDDDSVTVYRFPYGQLRYWTKERDHG